MIPWKDYLHKELSIGEFTEIFASFDEEEDYRNAPVYSRWGDGEFSAIFQIEGKNCDGHQYYSEMGTALNHVLKTQYQFGSAFYCGLVPIAVKVFGDRINQYVYSMFQDMQTGENFSNVFAPKWISGNILMEANREGQIGGFLKMLRDKYRILYVGPKRLRPLENDDFINICGWVEVSSNDAWRYHQKVYSQIITDIFSKRCNMICFSAGMPSKVLIYEIRRVLKNIPMIDFGSMWDGYFGYNSRKYHNDYDWDQVREKNLK